MGDDPRVRNGQDIVEPVNEFREHWPAIVMTHGFEDPYNMDHPPANHRTLEAGVCTLRSRADARRSSERPIRVSGTSSTRKCSNAFIRA
jgi:hypothetical protein